MASTIPITLPVGKVSITPSTTVKGIGINDETIYNFGKIHAVAAGSAYAVDDLVVFEIAYRCNVFYNNLPYIVISESYINFTETP